ncbi:translation initiation factor IF-2, partial [Citrobacter sp. AAK_AS5]
MEILGLRGSPTAGEVFAVVPSESEAREIAERRNQRRRIRKGTGKTQLTLDNLADQMTEGEVINLNIILKADVQGSLEAVSNALLRIKSD